MPRKFPDTHNLTDRGSGPVRDYSKGRQIFDADTIQFADPNLVLPPINVMETVSYEHERNLFTALPGKTLVQDIVNISSSGILTVEGQEPMFFPTDTNANGTFKNDSTFEFHQTNEFVMDNFARNNEAPSLDDLPWYEDSTNVPAWHADLTILDNMGDWMFANDGGGVMPCTVRIGPFDTQKLIEINIGFGEVIKFFLTGVGSRVVYLQYDGTTYSTRSLGFGMGQYIHGRVPTDALWAKIVFVSPPAPRYTYVVFAAPAKGNIGWESTQV